MKIILNYVGIGSSMLSICLSGIRIKKKMRKNEVIVLDTVQNIAASIKYDHLKKD